jgi:hypothetical protein
LEVELLWIPRFGYRTAFAEGQAPLTSWESLRSMPTPCKHWLFGHRRWRPWS